MICAFIQNHWVLFPIQIIPIPVPVCLDLLFCVLFPSIDDELVVVADAGVHLLTLILLQLAHEHLVILLISHWLYDRLFNAKLLGDDGWPGARTGVIVYELVWLRLLLGRCCPARVLPFQCEVVASRWLQVHDLLVHAKTEARRALRMRYDVLFDPALVELGARELLDWIICNRVEHPTLPSYHLPRVDYGVIEGAWVMRNVNRIGFV